MIPLHGTFPQTSESGSRPARTLSDYLVGPAGPAARHSGGAAAVSSVRPPLPRRVVHRPGTACRRRAARGPLVHVGPVRRRSVPPGPAAGWPPLVRVGPARQAGRHSRMNATSRVAAQLSSRAPLRLSESFFRTYRAAPGLPRSHRARSACPAALEPA